MTLILLMIGVIAARADSEYKSDFEIFDAFPRESSGKSQSLFPDPSTFEFLDEEVDRNKRYAHFDLSHYGLISPEPEFTRTKQYISPVDVEKRFVRSAPDYGNEYTDGYKAFLEKYFDKSEQDRPNEYFTDDSERSDDDENKETEAKSGNLRRKPDEVEHIGGNDDDYNSSEYERIKALSKKQETEIKQNPKHCKVTLKDGMTCSLCKNPETGAHSESCSFSSTPPEKKYAYTKERNYNSKDNEKDEDEGDDEEEGEEEEEASNKSEKKVTTTQPSPPATKQQQRRRGPQRSANQKSAAVQEENASSTPANHRLASQRRPRQRPSSSTNKPVTSTSRRYSASYKAEESRPQHRIVGLDPFLYGSHSDDKQEKEKPKRNTGESSGRRSYEDYFSHVFPEAKNGRLQRADVAYDDGDDQVEFLPNYDSKKNVEKVLEEFKTKDWSTCKKEIKGDLTCYHCKDENGVRHEECMFVSGSTAPDKPKSSRLSYSETKEYHHPRDSESYEPTNVSSKIVSKKSSNNNDESPNTGERKKKASRKLVVRKRKAKVAQNLSDVPKPEDVEDYHSGEKKSIKRMVTYRIENSSGKDAEPAESVVFGHQFLHEE